MKNKKSKINKRTKILFLCILLLLVVGGVFCYPKFLQDSRAKVSQEEQVSAEKADVDDAKEKVEEERNTDTLKDQQGQDTDSSVSTSAVLSGLTFSQSGGFISSAVNISGVDSGVCTFIFTDDDGRAISKTAELSSGGCSVSAPEAEFTMIGEYNLTVKFGDSTISKKVNIS